MDDLNKIIEDAKKGIGASQSAIESASSAVSLVISQAIASGLQLSEQGINVASESAAWAMDQGQAIVDDGIKTYKEAENAAFSAATKAIHFTIENPYLAYPIGGASALLVLPFTRRLIYRATIGNLRSPEAVVKSCEGRVKAVGGQMEDFSKEVEKLRDRMAKAEEEYRSGMNKLRATRVEMQRLSASLSRGERSSALVVSELRSLPTKVEGVLQLRSDAAGNASKLRSHRYKLDSWVTRIANMDI